MVCCFEIEQLELSSSSLKEDFSLLSLVELNFIGKIGSLILIDEFCDPFGLGLTSVGESLGVGVVGETEI